MAIALLRKAHSVDVHDADAVRQSLMERVGQEVLLKGSPHPRVYLVGDGFEETFDLDAMSKTQKGAHAGATFQVLRSRPKIERRFVTLVMETENTDGSQGRFALLFEEIDGDDGVRRWWMAMLPFAVDTTTGLGLPGAAWQPSQMETDNPAHLWPFLRDFAFPPVGARAADVVPPRLEQPDILVRFDEFRPDATLPADARQMAEFAGALAANDLMKGTIKGSVVLRLAGRAWEMWVLGDNQPASLEDMIRYAANRRGPVADGMALVMIAVRPQDSPPVPGIQIVAEKGGMFVESWAPLVFPEGPAGPKLIQVIHWRNPTPVPDDGMWIGVDPMVLFDLGPLGPEA